MSTFLYNSGTNSRILSVYADDTCILSSTYSTRIGFKYRLQPYVNGVSYSVLTAQPDPVYTYGFIDPAPVASSAISYDINYKAAPYLYGTNSIKSMTMSLGEEYSNQLNILSVTNSTGGRLRLNLSDVHRLQVNDRIKIEMTSSTLNQQYNNYWKVLTTPTTTSITVDAMYVTQSVIETGVVYEGVEFYDSLFAANGAVQIQTTNPHEMNVGDTFTLQMDTWAFGQLNLTQSVATGSLYNITVNGVNILGATISYNTSLANTAQLIVTQINSYTSNPDYTAYAGSGSSRVFVYSTRDNGDATVGMVLNYTSDQIGIENVTPTMRKTATASVGWNPQFTGIWNVVSVDSATLFTTNIPYGNNTISGSERGTIINENNYLFMGMTVSPSVFIGNYTRQYQDGNINRDIPQQPLTNAPTYSQYYSSLNDYATYDIYSGVTLTGFNTSPYQLYVIKYDSNDLITGTFNTTINFSSSVVAQNRITIGSGPANINSQTASFIDNNVSYYDVQLNHTTGTIIKRYRKKCAKHPVVRLMFLNSFGAFDYFTFYGSKTQTNNIESNYYDRGYNGVFAGNRWGRSDGSRGPTSYRINSVPIFTIYSDIVLRTELMWMQELADSSCVYEMTDTGLIPIQLLDEPFLIPDDRVSIKTIKISYRYLNRTTQQN